MGLEAMYNLILRTKGFAFDFEAKDDQGRPSYDPLVARPFLLAVASGVHKNEAICVDWTPRSMSFLNALLRDSRLVAVCHYGYFDYMLAHWCGCVDLHDTKATLHDSRMLCWMEFEEDDLGIKFQVEKKFGYRMTTFDEAWDNEFSRAADELEASKADLTKAYNARIREIKAASRNQIATAKADIAQWDKPRKEINEAKRSMVAGAETALERSLAEEETQLQMTLGDIDGRIRDMRDKSIKLMRAYAADDARQCWRLFKHQMGWVRKNSLMTWLDIELANFKRSLLMTADGTYIDQSVAGKMLEAAEPIMKEFEAEIYNLSKRQFNLNSPIQLAEVLYRDLGIPVPSGTARSNLKALLGKPWGFSTDKEVLERIDHPIGQALLNWRAVDTLHKNFMIGLRDQAKADPLKKSRVHVTFNTTGTRTGRYSSSA